MLEDGNAHVVVEQLEQAARAESVVAWVSQVGLFCAMHVATLRSCALQCRDAQQIFGPSRRIVRNCILVLFFAVPHLADFSILSSAM